MILFVGLVVINDVFNGQQLQQSAIFKQIFAINVVFDYDHNIHRPIVMIDCLVRARGRASAARQSISSTKHKKGFFRNVFYNPFLREASQEGRTTAPPWHRSIVAPNSISLVLIS